MKITYNGSDAVDVPGHDDVQPGQTIDVTDEVGASLLAAGTSYPADGPPIPPTNPAWSVPSKKAAAADESSTVAKKES